MRRRSTFIELSFTLLAVALLVLWFSEPEPAAQSAVSAPSLMWQYGGCLSGPSCQTGWYSSPAVVDLEGDGQADVIWGASDVVALNGASGGLKWRAAGANRVWPGIAIADLTGNGTLEVVVGRNSDQLTVYNRFGTAIWTRNPFGSGELRTLAVADLETDGSLEIIVGHAGWVESRQINIFAPDGSVRAGWPARHDGEPGYGGGMWNANVAVADMNGDGFKEVFGPTGSHYITALDRNGSQLPVNGIYSPRQFWSEVGVHVDHAVDVRGWVNCGVEHRPSFGVSAPVIADVDGNGAAELIVIGSVHNCGTNPYTELYQLPFILKPDRARWSGSGFDWTVIPSPGINSGPRSLDYNVIENLMPNAVAADLDGDGFKEILFPSYDGKVHAYSLDRTEHGEWPYTIPTSGAGGDDFRFASEPIVVDLNNDSHAEVIFTSWPKKATGRVGQLHIVDYRGVALHQINLPAPASGATWNGAMGAPTIANIDADPDLEVVVGTVSSGVVAYKLPNSANARVLWKTGRGDYGRTGAPATEAIPPPDATAPTVAITSPPSGATVRGTVSVTANASDNVGVTGVQFKLDGANLGAEDVSAPYTLSWNTLGASNGSHTLTAVARDAAGNSITSAAVTVTVDNGAPSVSITAPAAGGTVSGTITVSAAASDTAGVVGVQFRLDGAALGVEDTSAPYSVAWNTSTASNGTHTLTAVARDAAGNSTASAPVTVAVDNAAPSVILTAPASGSTVSATITVSADASDNRGVTGVQFFADGTPIGGEDITAPYSTTWDTTTAANGSHALSARARDAAGNSTTSTAITVTVANGGGGTTLRIEDGNTAIAYDNGWNVGNTSRPWSGGTAAIGFGVGQDAFVDFRGTGITWIGFRGPWAGIANVHLDGTFVTTLDLYAPGETVEAPVFTATGLAPGPHTLRIEVTRTKNAASVDYVVVVDAFDIKDAPPDANAPAVTMTSPSGGTTVSGTVPVTASASDDTGVAAVTFFVDGTPLGSPDTISPFSVNWTTSSVADGAHTLTATARDAAGNTRTSAPVTVTVANSAPPQLSTATRIENNHLGITYVDGCVTCGQVPTWFHGSRSRGWSDGTASFNRADGGRATFTFTGTGIKWIGFRATWAGIARVSIDNGPFVEVDLYRPNEEEQVPVFQIADLAPGSHTIAVEATGRKHPDAQDYAVVVDAFDVMPAQPPPVEGTRSEETAASTTFTPGWTQNDTSQAWSGGTAATSSGVGERATFMFTGTAVNWIGRRAPDMGIARVYLDGAFQAQVDTYYPTSIQGSVYSLTGLAPGAHRLEIEVTGLRHASATGHTVVVDAFDVRARIEENDAGVTYTGTWAFNESDRNWSDSSLTTGAGTAARASVAGARAEVRFTGTAVTWVGMRGPTAGIADVSIDGVFTQRVDLYAPTEQVQVPIFTASGLAPGAHTLRIDVTGDKNAAATATRVLIDAFDVTIPPPAPAVTRVQETSPAIAYTAGWTASGQARFWSGENANQHGTVGARATFSFTGTAARWIGERGFSTGVARVLLDGVFVGNVDTRTSFQEEYQEPLLTLTGLAPGSHTLTIEVVGRAGEAPGTTVEPVVIDAFDSW